MRWIQMLTLSLVAAATVCAAEVKVVRLPGGGKVPDAQVDAKGSVHVAYLADNDVYYIRSDNDGRTFSQPLRVNTEAGFASGGGYRGPDLAVTADGAVHVVWYNAGFQQKRPKNQWGVMYARLPAGADAFEKARNLNRMPSDNYALAVDGARGVAVVWMAEKLYVQQSRDGGQTFAPPRALQADPCECCAARARFDDKGRLQILYREKYQNNRDMHVSTVRSGKVVGRTRLGPGTWKLNACPMTGGSLFSDAQRTVAAWEQKGAVYFGEVSAGRRGALKAVEASGRGKWPFAVTTADGGTVVFWKQGSALAWAAFDDWGMRRGGVQTKDGVGPDRPAAVFHDRAGILVFP